MERIRGWLKFAGKNHHKVAAVFGVSPPQCSKGVAYLRKNIPEIPIYLFTTRQPDQVTAGSCQKVVIEEDSMALLIAAEKELWPHWVVLSLATWTGERGAWPIKLAPFLIPPFRPLLMNERSDFFPAGRIREHASRRLKDAAISVANRLKDINRGLWLLLFSTIAQWSAPISRRAFQKRSGTEAIPLSRDSFGGGVREILTLRYSGRRWDRAEFQARIENTNASHILLQQAPAADDVADLQRLFSDPTTFAVSRQPSYRLWHPTIIPTAPFRQLQPGTASATIAPISPSILIDRAKLVALGGLPDTVVPGSALLLLFWKAAAAGWTSYSGGCNQALEEIQDWPYEEAEFAVRVLSDPSLKRLGPQDPDRKRGNITFQVRESPTYTPDRPRVLVVSPYLPYPLSHGGAVRIYNLCRALSARADLLLASFRESTDYVHFDKLHEVFREVYVVDIDEKRSPDPTLPGQVRGHLSKSMRALVAGLCETRAVDILQIEFTHLAHFRDAAPGTPAILVEHDLTFTLYQQLAGREGTRKAHAEYERWRTFEEHWLRRYDAVWTMSEEDCDRAIQAGSPEGRTYAVPNGVDLDRFRPANELSDVPEVFYVGSFRHLPNIIGYERLRHEIMPHVWSKIPQARLRVVAGPNPERYWQEFQHRPYPAADPRIQVHAFVEDLRPLYAKAQVVVTPLLVSAGTNIKVLEAMACQKAVVSTPIGCAGLGLTDGKDALIRKESPQIAEAIITLLEDPILREAIAVAARHTVEQRFSWDVIAEGAYETYMRMMAGAPAR